MNIRLTGAVAALVAALMAVPAAQAHGGFAPSGGHGNGPMMRDGGVMDRGEGHGSGHGYGHGGMMGHGQADPRGCGMSGMMGHGHGHGHGSMMGHGHGHGQGGMMGHGQGGMMGAAPPLAEDLSVDGVKHIMGHRVAMMQNPNLKVGNVTEVDGDTITADVVTQDGSLVRRYTVDRHTGVVRPADMLTNQEQ